MEIRKIFLSKNSEKKLIIWKMSVILATFLLFFPGANHFVRIDINLKNFSFTRISLVFPINGQSATALLNKFCYTG